MTEPINDVPRPELCMACEKGWSCIRVDYTECVESRELWDSGYAAGKAASREAESKLAELVRVVEELLSAVDLVPGTYQCMGELDYQTLLSAADSAQSAIRDEIPLTDEKPEGP